MKPTRGPFGGNRGHLYHNGTIYHHGSASFPYGASTKLTRKVIPEIESVLCKAIAEGRLQLTLAERVRLSASLRLRRLT